MANADDLRGLTAEVAKAYEDRMRRLATIKKETATIKREATKLLDTIQKENRKRESEVHSLMKDFDKEHKEMSTAMKATLAEVNPTLAKDESNRLAQTQKEIKIRVDEVSKMLKDFDKEHKEMSTALKATLAEVNPTLAKDESNRLAQTQKEIKIRANEVSEMLDDFRKEQADTAAAWQDLVATMQAKREAKPAAAKVAPKEVATEKEIPKKVAVKEVALPPPPEASLEKMVLSFINSHAEGVKVGEMEKPLGTPRMRLGLMAKSLLDQGRVRKKGDKYYPSQISL